MNGNSRISYVISLEIIPPNKILRSTRPLVVEDLSEEEWQAGAIETLHNGLAEEGCVIVGVVQFTKLNKI